MLAETAYAWFIIAQTIGLWMSKVYFFVCSTSQILIPTFVTGQKQRTAAKQIKIKSNL